MQKNTCQNSVLTEEQLALRSRRNTMLGIFTLAVSGRLFSGCQSKPKLQCAGKDQLSLSEDMARKGRQYVEISKRSEEDCANCSLFRPSKITEPACGVCGVDGLPAHPQGYCVSWAPISA